ncbi:MAC/perforin domain-containing protein [Vibrio jasicida]|uniref:MAC/perforin domain-containing protein n=1 Tax=Vibrio jasicida TaxID=766224 RepID=A0ABW7JBK4_9VIBR
MKIIIYIITCFMSFSILADEVMDNSQRYGDLYWLSKYGYDEVEPSITQVSHIDFGTGIVMRSPYDSKVVLSGPFSNKSKLESFVSERQDLGSYKRWQYDFREERTLEEESKFAYLYFKYASSFSAAASYVSSRRNEWHTFYFVINSELSVPMVDELDVDWQKANPPVTESMIGNSQYNQETLIDQFVELYGSHYVTGIKAGWRLVAEVSVRKSDYQKRREISSAFKAWKVKGSMSAGDLQKFSSESVQVRVAMVSGGVFNSDGTEYHFKDQISAATDFVDKWNNSEISVKAAPISFSLQSYWPHLYNHPKSRNLLEPKRGYAVSTDKPLYGVPPGTIISWLPSLRDWVFNPVTSRDELRVPEGWELLSNTLSFSDPDGTLLNEFFLIGSKLDKNDIGTFVGRGKHSHTGSTNSASPSTTKVDNDSDKTVNHGSHSHSVTVNEQDHTPRSLKVIWLRKL